MTLDEELRKIAKEYADVWPVHESRIESAMREAIKIDRERAHGEARKLFEDWWKNFGRFDNKNTRREVTAWIGFREGYRAMNEARLKELEKL